MNKHDFEKHPLAVGQVWNTRSGEQVTLLGYDDDGDEGYPWDSYENCYTEGGLVWRGEEDDGDLVELIYDPNIVAPLKEYIPKFNRKEILQAVLDDKPILFRVDEGETWQEVKDNNWVLRMIADQTEYCFKVAPSSIIISDGKAYEGDLVWWHNRAGPKQVTLNNLDGDLDNAKEYPHFYSLREPEYEMKKVYKYVGR